MNGGEMESTKSNAKQLIENGRQTRFGIDWPGQRCLAGTRRGGRCQCPAVKGTYRCRIHGGLSTGPQTKIGKEKARQTVLKHGHFTKTAIAERKRILSEIAEFESCRK